MTFVAYFDRNHTTIEGLFTLQQIEGGKVVKLFERLPARSGQAGFTNTNWERSKSPIPFGEHALWLKPMNVGQWAGRTGIGEFFHIGTVSDPLVITDGRADHIRRAVGLHPENSLPGSSGCIVLLADTPGRRAEVTWLFKFLAELGKTTPCISLRVV